MSTYEATGTVRNVNYPAFGGSEESNALVRRYEELDNQLGEQIHNVFRQRRLARRPIDPELLRQFNARIRQTRLAMGREEAIRRSELDRQGAPMTGVRPSTLSFTEEMIPRTDPTMLNRRVRPEPLNLTGMQSGYDPNLLERRQPINPTSSRYRSNVIPARRSARNR